MLTEWLSGLKLRYQCFLLKRQLDRLTPAQREIVVEKVEELLTLLVERADRPRIDAKIAEASDCFDRFSRSRAKK